LALTFLAAGWPDSWEADVLGIGTLRWRLIGRIMRLCPSGGSCLFFESEQIGACRGTGAVAAAMARSYEMIERRGSAGCHERRECSRRTPKPSPWRTLGFRNCPKNWISALVGMTPRVWQSVFGTRFRGSLPVEISGPRASSASPVVPLFQPPLGSRPDRRMKP